MHRIMLDPDLVTRLTAERGGKLHVIDTLDPARTAHLVIDMQNGFVEAGGPVEVPMARRIVPAVNRISRAVRAAGGQNYFVQFTTPVGDLSSWSTFYSRFSPATSKGHQDAFTPGAHYWQLWPELDVDESADVAIEKRRFGAFIPGTCDLDADLRARGIDTLIISGTLTNCCCESTARDAMQLNYRVIFATDTNAALTDAEHNMTLNNMLFLFADVRSSEEIAGLLEPAMAPAG
ncbi:MAG TPA: cysteine hydrolase [Sphingobium sp.]|nr:cysteine hydrolase [Sphingobium sp.]